MTRCYACDAELVPDIGAPDDPVTYQFDNCLWIGFHGGYGMFVDNLEAKLPTNTEDRWLRDEDGEYRLWVGQLVENEAWEPEYREDRILAGHPDYETVICHDCAHKLCVDVPWLDRLLHPRCSHTHRTSWLAEHPEHPDHHPGCELHGQRCDTTDESVD